MRSWPAQLVAELQGAGRVCQALYIERQTGLTDSSGDPITEALALTAADIPGTVADIPIGGSVAPSVTFTPSPEGVTFSQWSRTLGTDVDNAEAEILDGGSLNIADVLDERWHGAPWVAGVYSWAHPEYGFGPLSCGHVGKIKSRVGRFVVELRDLRQMLNGNPTPVTQKGCLWILGSNSEQDGFCTLDLAPWTVTELPVTAVASQREFTCDVLNVDPDDTYGNGLLTWTLGLNAGRTVRVHSFVGGVITLTEDMVKGIAVDDEFTIIAGCRGRFDEDCVTKFDNALNFGGQPHAPGPDRALNPKGDDA